MKFKNDEKLTVATNEVGKTITLKGHTYLDHFFVSKNRGRGRGYRVTHKMSGLFVLNDVPTIEQAHTLCQIILPDIDWRFSSPRQVWEEDQAGWAKLLKDVSTFEEYIASFLSKK